MGADIAELDGEAAGADVAELVGELEELQPAITATITRAQPSVMHLKTEPQCWWANAGGCFEEAGAGREVSFGFLGMGSALLVDIGRAA